MRYIALAFGLFFSYVAMIGAFAIDGSAWVRALWMFCSVLNIIATVKDYDKNH